MTESELLCYECKTMGNDCYTDENGKLVSCCDTCILESCQCEEEEKENEKK